MNEKPITDDFDIESLRDFIIEVNSNLDNTTNSLIFLENNPTDEFHINSVFRVFHSIKGSCGFFNLNELNACGGLKCYLTEK